MTAPETTAESLSPVSRTALAVARVRALESERPDALFNDPYAGAFVAAARYTRGDARPVRRRPALPLGDPHPFLRRLSARRLRGRLPAGGPA
ncbi:hypothetical protein GCM10020000_74380 [Streptomyces olivoverticillatus]